jgi:Xaa-Pro aminopeptidase
MGTLNHVATKKIMSDFLIERRARVAKALPLDDALLLVGAGEPVPLPEGTDKTYPFRAHAEYYYLAGLECPGGVVAFDPRDGEWVSFVPDISEAERVWEGRTQPAGESIATLEPWLTARRGRTIAALGAPLRGVCADEARSARVREHLHHARRPKDDHDLDLMRRAVAVTAAGFTRIRDLLRPGITERALQIELEAEFARYGATRPGYGTIIGTGPNAAVLHFEPSARTAYPGEFVLVDAGAELDRCLADVTRTFVVGEPDAFHRDFYQVVLAAQERAIARCVPGAEWKEIHLACAADPVRGLVELHLMRGQPDSLAEQEVHLLFFPHGLGHLVGLGVRDASDTQPAAPKTRAPH